MHVFALKSRIGNAMMITDTLSRFLSRLTLGKRLYVISVLLAVSVLWVSGIAWEALSNQSQAARSVLLLSQAKSLQQDSDMLHDALKSDIYRFLLRDYSRDEKEEMKRLQETHARQFRDNMTALVALPLDGGLDAALVATRQQAEVYISKSEAMINLAIQDRQKANLIIQTFEYDFDRLAFVMDEQTKLIDSAMTVETQISEAAVQSSKRWILIAAVSAILGVALLLHVIIKSIYSSVEQIGQVARSIADGDLTSRSDIATKDVLGALAQAINQMANNLHDTIGRMRTDSERDAFSNQLGDAMEMAHTETDAYAVIARGMQVVSDNHAMELLLSDSSQVHLERATQHPLEGAPGCEVGLPFDCTAVRRGTVVSFADSEALNACPRLRGRPNGRISAVCLPVTFMGQALGVMHATSSVEKPLTAYETSQMAILGAQSGARIGTIRAFQRSQTQASTDSLTGLLNRRSIEHELRNLIKAGKSFAFILADIDHFKNLNDTHGHQAGDTALRVLSDVLRGAAREGDLIGRWGGEEFLFILPNATAAQGFDWANRLRDKLAETLGQGKAPIFTVSFGIADSSMSVSSEELQIIADAALYHSKDAGRDRATIATATTVGKIQPRHGTEHPAGINMNSLAEQN